MLSNSLSGPDGATIAQCDGDYPADWCFTSGWDTLYEHRCFDMPTEVFAKLAVPIFLQNKPGSEETQLKLIQLTKLAFVVDAFALLLSESLTCCLCFRFSRFSSLAIVRNSQRFLAGNSDDFESSTNSNQWNPEEQAVHGGDEMRTGL